VQNRLSLFTEFYTHHTRFLFVPNPTVVSYAIDRLNNVGRRPQIWPTQKFWRGAPYAANAKIIRRAQDSAFFHAGSVKVNTLHSFLEHLLTQSNPTACQIPLLRGFVQKKVGEQVYDFFPLKTWSQ